MGKERVLVLLPSGRERLGGDIEEVTHLVFRESLEAEQPFSRGVEA